MKLLSEPELIERYRQFNASHLLRSASISSGEEILQWSWVDCGSGEDIVLLLPGFLGEAETSFLYMQGLESIFRVLSVTYPSSIRTVDALCDGIVALLDHVQVTRVNVLGGSYSGYLAQALVRRHPNRMKSLILTHTGPPTKKYANVASAFLFVFHLLPAWLSRWLAQLSRHFFFAPTSQSASFWKEHFSDVIKRQSREAMLNRFRLMRDFHRNFEFHAGDLSAWHGFLLIMEMARDGFSSDEDRAVMRRLYPNAQVHTFPDAAHMDSVDRPEEQIRVIKDFLQKLDDSKSQGETTHAIGSHSEEAGFPRVVA